MSKPQGLTLIELLVVIAVIILLVVIIIPGTTNGPQRRAVLKMKNGTQQTAIAKNLILWSDQFYQATQDFPRANPPLAPEPTLNSYQIANNQPESRAAALVNTGDDALSVNLLINPVGTDKVYSSPATALKTVLAPTNLSYAMLDAKNFEWKNRVNSQAPLLCDRQVPTKGSNASFWNTKCWEGNVVWGDTHVTWESGQKTTDWPSTSINGVTNPHDDLFAGAAGPTSTDALMYNPADPAGN